MQKLIKKNQKIANFQKKNFPDTPAPHLFQFFSIKILLTHDHLQANFELTFSLSLYM